MKINLDWINSSRLEEELSAKDIRVRLSKISKYIRFFSVIVSIVLPIAFTIYGVVVPGNDGPREWYEILLLGLAGLCVAFVSMGALILLLKPFLFFIRVAIIRITKKEENASYIANCENVANWLLSLKSIDEETSTLVQKYKDNLEALKDLKLELIKLKLKTDRLAEWKWVVWGISVIAMIIAIWEFFQFLIVLLIAFLILMAYYATRSNRYHHRCYYPEKHRQNNENDEYEPWFARLYNSLEAKEIDNNNNILAIKTKIREHTNISEKVYQQLLLKCN